MNYHVITIVGGLLLMAGCNQQSQRPNNGSFKLFGSLRSPKNLNFSLTNQSIPSGYGSKPIAIELFIRA